MIELLVYCIVQGNEMHLEEDTGAGATNLKRSQEELRMAMISIFEVVWRDLHGLLPSGGTAKFHRCLVTQAVVMFGNALAMYIDPESSHPFMARPNTLERAVKAVTIDVIAVWLKEALLSKEINNDVLASELRALCYFVITDMETCTYKEIAVALKRQLDRGDRVITPAVFYASEQRHQEPHNDKTNIRGNGDDGGTRQGLDNRRPELLIDLFCSYFPAP
ncbi:hypothetical protein K443DRAFT_119490 [Laccaria amethystina LaAM-08-1]|uniref:Uncharacterized protein n=1 Tax=Laccaria amethystina LaAM-08-1 TaxID=1095629 RepID=A0A0C9XRE7_9AGAR|nr:hypothetical protein K443DRAFT_119490 [Laccaria amethystina LaAM-08-1]